MFQGIAFLLIVYILIINYVNQTNQLQLKII